MYKRAYTLCLLLVVLLGSATVETRGQTLESQTSHETVKGIRFTGKVVDTDGEPVPGAGVVCNEKNSVGTTADLDGKFNVTLPPSARSVTFSSIGMKNLTVLITQGKTTDVTIVMESADNHLDQVVVT